MSDTQRIIDRLTTAGITVYDGQPQQTPSGSYAAVFDTTGVASPHRLSTRSHWTQQTHRVVLVARTPIGLRDLVATARAALTDHHLTLHTSPLRETVDAPVISDGPDTDKRLSKTLTYSHHSPTERAT